MLRIKKTRKRQYLQMKKNEEKMERTLLRTTHTTSTDKGTTPAEKKASNKEPKEKITKQEMGKALKF